jgi:CPA2 family monovalent cation:H+ antiporter-2
MHLAIAAAAPPEFFFEVVALLVTTALVAYFCHRIGIMPIVAFLVTGALIGPHALGFVRDEALIEATAEVGVILLLFTIGIEFSLEKLSRIKRIILIGGGLQVGLVIALVAGLLAAAGVDWRMGVFTGCLVALSSTAIVMKLLMSAGEVASEEGQASLGILIFQDLAVVAMVLLVPMLGGSGASGWGIGFAFAKAIGIVALVLLTARRIMPLVLEAVARTCSQEIFLLSVVAICFGTAYLTSLAGVSLSLGAFLAGLIVSESRFSQLAFAEILPLQILFSATFFVSVGLLFDLGFVLQNPLLVLGVIGAVFAIKLATTGIGLRVLGYGMGSAACASVLLAQIGEFSFVLERTGRGVGLFPAGFEVGGPETFIAATVALMIATPFVYPLAERIRRGSLQRREDQPVARSDEDIDRQPELRDHVIIAGLGDVGRRLAQVLAERRIPFLILTLDPDRAHEAESAGLRVLRGNYTRTHELELSGLRSARLLVVADDDQEMTRRVVEAARALSPDLRVLARARLASEVPELREAGAGEVVLDHQESAARLLARVLESYDVSPDDIRHDQDDLRSVGGPGTAYGEPVALGETARRSDRCSHTGQAREVIPSAPGCEDCLRMGKRGWVHLRICMTCGHVGCCNQSPGDHAAKHHRSTGHPIIKSIEPGESWAWCYEDQTYL